MQVFGSSHSPIICLKFKLTNLSMAASSICLNEEFSADEVKHHKPSRAAYAHVEKEKSSPRNCALSPATHGTLSAPSRQAGVRR
jgi:hypothetical protein